MPARVGQTAGRGESAGRSPSEQGSRLTNSVTNHNICPMPRMLGTYVHQLGEMEWRGEAWNIHKRKLGRFGGGSRELLHWL